MLGLVVPASVWVAPFAALQRGRGSPCRGEPRNKVASPSVLVVQMEDQGPPFDNEEDQIEDYLPPRVRQPPRRLIECD